MMTDRTFNLLMYTLTPITLVVGLVILYLLVGDDPWFGYMAGGYTMLLVVMYLIKLSLFRKYLTRRSPQESKTIDG
ncbi:MAG: hypothetical protein JXA28_12465 [Bacteroidetes bacterium]|nr:hypothetical protein [Bacteroidota bacterium]